MCVPQEEVVVVPSRPALHRDTDPRDSSDSYRSGEGNRSEAFVVHTPTREERAALSRSVGRSEESPGDEEDRRLSWERAAGHGGGAGGGSSRSNLHQSGSGDKLPIARGHFNKAGDDVDEDLYDDDFT